MNLQSQQTCQNPSVCVWYFPAKVSVLMWWIAQMFINTHTPPCRTSVSQLCVRTRPQAPAWWKHVTRLCERKKQRATIWFCLAQTDCNLTLTCSCTAISTDTQREREKNRHKRKRGKWPLYLSPDQNKTRWTTFQMLLVQQDLDTVSAGLLCVQVI